MKQPWRVIVFVAIALVLLGVAASQRGEFVGAIRAVGPKLPLAVVLIVLGLLGGALGWAALAPAGGKLRACAAFLASQPAKYLPFGGTVAQVAAQIGISAVDKGARRRVGMVWLVHVVIQVSAAGALGALGIVLIESSPAKVGLAVASVGVAIGGYMLVQPANIDQSLASIARLLRRTPTPTGPLPAGSIMVAWAWTIVPLAMSGLSFGLLAIGPENGRLLVGIVGAYAFAWIVGFLALPVPSGVGVREAVLVWFLHWMSPVSVVAVSIAHRVAVAMGEMILFAAAGVTIALSDRLRGGGRSAD